MAKADEKAPARLRAYLDALDTWAATLDDDRRADPALRRIAARSAQATGLTPALAEQAELGLWHDVTALREDFPDAPPVPRATLAGVVRATLRRLAEAHPGRLVEVRVPPFGAVQIGRPGVNSVHRRGTPPNVVETDPATWLLMVVGDLSWDAAVASARVSASGAHAQLDDVVPLA